MEAVFQAAGQVDGRDYHEPSEKTSVCDAGARAEVYLWNIEKWNIMLPWNSVLKFNVDIQGSCEHVLVALNVSTWRARCSHDSMVASYCTIFLAAFWEAQVPQTTRDGKKVILI
jgi:hypothetical protein